MTNQSLHEVTYTLLLAGWTNPRNLVAMATKFCRQAPNIFSVNYSSVISIHKKAHQFAGTQQTAPDNNDVHVTQEFGSSAWNYLM